MTRLPFTTDDVRDQCAQFGDAPLAHPLPVKHLLLMCDHIDDLEKLIETAKDRGQKLGEAWALNERRIDSALRLCAGADLVAAGLIRAVLTSPPDTDAPLGGTQ